MPSTFDVELGELGARAVTAVQHRMRRIRTFRRYGAVAMGVAVAVLLGATQANLPARITAAVAVACVVMVLVPPLGRHRLRVREVRELASRLATELPPPALSEAEIVRLIDQGRLTSASGEFTLSQNSRSPRLEAAPYDSPREPPVFPGPW